MKRRNFIKSTSLLTLPMFLNGLSVSAIARSAFGGMFGADNDKVLVLVQLRGGNDTLNTLIPLDQYSNLSKARANILIPESKVLSLQDGVGLHPAMTEMQNLWKEGQLNIMQSVGYPNQNRSHFRSTDIWQTGSAADVDETTGWLGRYFAVNDPDYPNNYPTPDKPDPFAVSIGSTASETCQGLIANYSVAFNGSGRSGELFEGEWDYIPNNCFGNELEYVRSTIRQSNAYSSVLQAAMEKGTNLSSKYQDDNTLARSLKIVANLISGGLKSKVYVVNLGGFDTHSAQVDSSDVTQGTHANLWKTVSDAIGAFQDDLNLQGLGERVVGLTYSEFGRRIKSNASLGTDHGDAVALFAFGTCINPTILGHNPEISDNVGRGESVPLQFDFRSIYGSVLMDWFDVGEDQVKSLLYEDFQYVPVIKGCTPTATDDPVITLAPFEMDISPNPANNYAKLTFETEEGFVRISLINELGGELDVLAAKKFSAGKHQLTLPLHRYPAGIYFVRLNSDKRQSTKRFVKI